MRLWVSLDSITFDEIAPYVGDRVEVALKIGIAYIGLTGDGQIHGGFPVDLSALGERELVQLPHLGRTMTALRGFVTQSRADHRNWWIDSAHRVNGFDPEGTLPRNIPDGTACEALGSLSIVGKELASTHRTFLSASLLKLQSLCLLSNDSRFGQWIDVRRYRDLGSDPDVIGAPVCVAEIELPY